MRDFITEDGKYYFVEQGDKNIVLYLRSPSGELIRPLWDKWSYEASIGDTPIVIPDNPNIPDIPNTPDRLVSEPILIERNVNPIGMSYWRNINNWAGQDHLEVLLAIDDKLWVYSIGLKNLQVISKRGLGIHHTGEGCHFSALSSDILFVPYGNGMDRINISNGDRDKIWITNGRFNLWQMHVSYDEHTISASIQDADWKIIKWGVWKDGIEKFFELEGNPDECQIDKSGNFLLCRETNPQTKEEYNRVFDVNSGTELMHIGDWNGAVGHSDCGFGCVMGEYDKSDQGGALNLINFQVGGQQILFASGIWNMGYVSCSSFKPHLSLAEQKCLMTTPENLISIECNGARNSRVICKNLTQSTQYEHRAKANLCPHGKYAVWTAFVDGTLNAYIVGVPEW